jgi:DEAD/DEAH box helicase domain-containing protein
MLPATLAQEVRRQVLHYLEATFHMRDTAVEAALRRFFLDPQNGLLKGPWLQARRPFRLASDSGADFFDIPIPFTPFRHQWRAWERLTSRANVPKHTLVTTGTGSGKTECFLYPILDHCLREQQAGRVNGIKAIVLYPMNALASDQAGRFAEEILRSDQLSTDVRVGDHIERKARVRVGLYTGRLPNADGKEGAESGTYSSVQAIVTPGGDSISYMAITDRQAMQDDPPDVLLTNYKMLDYLLLRPRDRAIWRYNEEEPDLLRYLVLDELHTYDGAQGADVACLIRRLKARLDRQQGSLCVVGTSATVAAGGDDETQQDPVNRLCAFASTLFEETITNDAVIEEDRYRVEEIIRPAEESPSMPDPADCEPRLQESAGAFTRRIAPLFGAPAYPIAEDNHWLAAVRDRGRLIDEHDGPDLPRIGDDEQRWGVALGEWLRAQPLFHALLRIAADGPMVWPELVRRLAEEDFALREVDGFEARALVLSGFLALVAQARELRSGRVFPLVPTQVQLWIRELRRLGRVVSPDPVFSWLDEPLLERRQLPTAHCTECGESVWVALHDPTQDSMVRQRTAGIALDDDAQRIYEGWGFDRRPPSRYLVLLSPWPEGDDPLPPDGQDGQRELEVTRYYLAPTELVLRVGPGPGPLTGEATFPVKVAHETRQREHDGQMLGVRRCPHCRAEDTLMFLGARAATTASVAIDELFGSVLNDDPKLLAFTDSVQDASHRAGFFSARTYHFTFRTALQRVIDDAGPRGVPLVDVGDRLLDYWGAPGVGRPGSLREAVATLIPPDLREYAPYLAFRAQLAGSPLAPALRSELVNRLNWEATSEFSLMLTHGRTMELHASATLGWDGERVAALVEHLQARLPAISQGLVGLNAAALTLWILGILHRQRERGALYHPYLDSYARQNYWGKHPFGRVVSGREAFPPAGRYRPRLLVTERDHYHDHVLTPPAPGQQRPWQLVWARRVLGVPSVSDTELLDLLSAALEAGDRVGVFRQLHRDGNKVWYAIDAGLAVLLGEGEKLTCSASGHYLFRPLAEARFWEDSPSLAYRDHGGRYASATLNERERYYRERYRKGALRRVFAFEHTGLLTTEEREQLELEFHGGEHADDPNVLTATSTLEMGIDIGDLSSTLLCSIPPSVASYLQRIGRAGRRTGTALIVAVVNQRPHDLFFFGRPADLLAGDIEPPGVWLDASAVLVRQYLAFVFDQAVRVGQLTDLPGSGRQLVQQVLDVGAGDVPDLLAWMTSNEADLQTRFLQRFTNDVLPDTIARFHSEAASERLRERIEQAAQDFRLQRQLLDNARKRLSDQKSALDTEADGDVLAEIEQEERIIASRARMLAETSALEVLTEHGLLPNYAFPERGVRFSGTTYNRYTRRASPQSASGGKSFDIVRASSSAIRELAPANHFYTHSHAFEIQQLEIGSRAQPLIEEWAVCGQCGHMRPADVLKAPETAPACPQCGYDGPEGQSDIGQHRPLLPLQRSQSISYMEYYDSLSADRGDDRESIFYRLAASFDTTLAQPSGAVGDDSLPFGVEYRAAVRLREVNAGFGDQPDVVNFAADTRVPEGFDICEHCGVVAKPGESRSDVRHRRSCSGRRQTEAWHREGRSESAYRWRQIWLYRELRSEAIRLLLPEVEQEDLDTLQACIYLGLRLRFQGNPAHLLVKPQHVPDYGGGITRHYLVLMDAVPGGTGFLKTLYQEADDNGLPGEGVMDVLRRARNALETCSCRRLHHSNDDTDGCYRCIRSYHLQYRAANISRERGIRLLDDLIKAGQQRSLRQALDTIKGVSLFGSVLEKRFIERLRAWVELQGGKWQEALIKGGRGFRFLLGDPVRSWDVQLQPTLGSAQGVSVACQPDFMLRCDDPSVRPIAVFADGFEPHVAPGKPTSRLEDDINKRRAILDSGAYHVWSLSWDDLSDDSATAALYFLPTYAINNLLPAARNQLRQRGVAVPDIADLTGNAWRQLCAFVRTPNATSWRYLAEFLAGFSLQQLAGAGVGVEEEGLLSAFEQWRLGDMPAPLQTTEQGDWCWINRIAVSQDLLAYAPGNSQLITGDFAALRLVLRLEDREEQRSQVESFRKRWREFHSLLNWFQFVERFQVFAVTECLEGIAAPFELSQPQSVDSDWAEVVELVASSVKPDALALAEAGAPIPEVEYYDDSLADELFAEMAWPDGSQRLAFLAGDQASFANQWQAAGWIVFTEQDVKAKGRAWAAQYVAEKAGKGESE